MSKLAAMRAALAEKENRGKSTQKTPGDNAIFPFWNMKENETSVVRFLPDADPENTFFWRERLMINLTFTGVKGTNDNKVYEVKVPCMEMYGEQCPILAEVRTWYKDESLKEMANKYWKKYSYIYQGLVIGNPLLGIGDDKEDTPPENPIRRFIFTGQIQPIIVAAMKNPEIEELPTDYNRGLNFNIIKTAGAQYASYATSNFARKETALTQEQRAAVEQFGLFDLKSFFPKKPSESELRIIREMFEASVDGRPYDLDKWGAYYKPWGLNAPAAPAVTGGDATDGPFEAGSKPVLSTSTTPPWEDEAPAASEPVKTSATTTGAKSDILALIRSRQNKPA